MKTVIKDGKVYEIGKYYLFSDTERNMTHYSKLKNTTLNGFLTSDDYVFYFIEELPASKSFGTITEAPIELKDGYAYMFEFEDNTMIGLYDIDEQTIHVRNLDIQVNACINIREMVVKEND